MAVGFFERNPMPDDTKAPAPVAPIMPASVTLNADYAWFTVATKNNPSVFVQRHKGEIINDTSEIAYLVGIEANITAG